MPRPIYTQERIDARDRVNQLLAGGSLGFKAQQDVETVTVLITDLLHWAELSGHDGLGLLGQAMLDFQCQTCPEITLKPQGDEAD